MVNAVDGFGDQPKVINGCSDLLVEVFGQAGRHARSAVGMGSLPGGIAVEIEMIVEVKDDAPAGSGTRSAAGGASRRAAKSGKPPAGRAAAGTRRAARSARKGRRH
jgi:hypothetical protein